MSGNAHNSQFTSGLGEALRLGHRLRSPMGRIWRNQPTKSAYYATGKLKIDRNSILPGGTNMPADDYANDLAFVDQLEANHRKAGEYTRYQLARVYGSRIADEPDGEVSLFDRNRLAAALAVCAQKSEGEELLYLKGAIGGIQKYIYNNIKAEQMGEARKVGKRLRGRSFLVSLLGELSAEYIVERLGLSPANVLFIGGGHFNLLLPKTEDIENQLDGLFWSINESLLQEFGPELHIYFATHDLRKSEKNHTNVRNLLLRLNDKLEQAKRKRYAGQLTNEVIFSRALSNMQGQKGEKGKEELKLEHLGSHIARCDYLLEVSGSGRAVLRNSFKKYLRLDALDTDVYLLADVDKLYDKLSNLSKNPTADWRLRLQRLNNTDILPDATQRELAQQLPLAYGFRLVGRHAPVFELDQHTNKKGDLIELEDLSAIGPEGEALGYQQLAALRMDVDDLGVLFAYGLGEKTDLSQLLGLSREFQLFFGGYFNRIAEAHRVYVVYSGGDDAFVLGSWLNILNFAQQLRTDFRQFTNNNDEIGFSAGIFLCHAKYPITRIQQDAGQLEGKAKQYKKSSPDRKAERPECADKDAVNVFGLNMEWARYIEMLQFGEKLEKAVGSAPGKRINRSVLQQLLGVLQTAQKEMSRSDAEKSDHFAFYRHVGRLYGLLAGRGYKSDQMIQQILQDMRHFDRFQDYSLPFHYVLYKSRRNYG